MSRYFFHLNIREKKVERTKEEKRKKEKEIRVNSMKAFVAGAKHTTLETKPTLHIVERICSNCKRERTQRVSGSKRNFQSTHRLVWLKPVSPYFSSLLVVFF